MNKTQKKLAVELARHKVEGARLRVLAASTKDEKKAAKRTLKAEEEKLRLVTAFPVTDLPPKRPYRQGSPMVATRHRYGVEYR